MTTTPESIPKFVIGFVTVFLCAYLPSTYFVLTTNVQIVVALSALVLYMYIYMQNMWALKSAVIAILFTFLWWGVFYLLATAKP